MFEWQTAPRRLVVQSECDWAGDKSTRMSVSAGNIRYGQHLLRSWSKDQTVIAMSSGEAELIAACMATQHAMGRESIARELGVHLDAMELQVDANAAIGIIVRQGLGKLRHLDLSYLFLHRRIWDAYHSARRVQNSRSRREGGEQGERTPQVRLRDETNTSISIHHHPCTVH